MTEEPVKLEDSDVNSHDGSDQSDSNDSDSAAPADSDVPPALDGATLDARTVPVEAAVAAPANSGYVTEDTETAHDVQGDKDALAHLGEPEDVDVAFTYSSHLDARRQIDANGVYLDDIERRDAELLRARAENREPDLDNPPPIASTPVVPTVVAEGNALGGARVPVDFVQSVNVGVPSDAVADNAAAAEAHGLNPDGTEKE